MSFPAKPGCEKGKEEMALRWLGGSTLPAVTRHSFWHIWNGGSGYHTQYKGPVLGGCQGMQGSAPKVQSKLRLEEETETVVSPVVVLGRWGGRWKQGGSGDLMQ